MFQFALEGALFELKAKAPQRAPLLELPPRDGTQGQDTYNP